MSVHQRYQELIEDQRQFFDDLITEEWESYHSAAWDFSRRYEVARLFRHLRPAVILDLGCGCGFHDAEMARYDFVTRVDAIDYSSQSVLKAEEAYPSPKVVRRVADLRSDNPESIYDLIVSFQVFEHLRDPGQYFQYCVRACRPGGAIAIVTPNGNRLDNRIRRLRGERPALVDPQHFREYTVAELRSLGRQHGLVARDSFAYGLQSLIYPRLTPASPGRATRWGAAVPAIANIIGVVFEVSGA